MLYSVVNTSTSFDVNELYPRIPFVLLENNVLDVRYPLSVSVMSALISDISLR